MDMSRGDRVLVTGLGENIFGTLDRVDYVDDQYLYIVKADDGMTIVSDGDNLIIEDRLSMNNLHFRPCILIRFGGDYAPVHGIYIDDEVDRSWIKEHYPDLFVYHLNEGFYSRRQYLTKDSRKYFNGTFITKENLGEPDKDGFVIYLEPSYTKKGEISLEKTAAFAFLDSYVVSLSDFEKQ